jgi:outer membrane receptor protein involved in Fe transport
MRRFSKSNLKSTVFRSTAARGAAMSVLLMAVGAQAAHAQAETEAITVTGSRIKTNDALSARPITVVTAEAFEKTKAVNVEQVLRKLPAVDFVGGISANTNNNGFGSSTVGMRALGPARTLVLVNGSRFPFTDAQSTVSAVDLGNIPVAMLDRVEVLRDGASALYGADAIAGVVNLITKTDFNGVSINADYGVTDKGDAQHMGIGLLAGASFDRGNILIYLGDDHRQPVWQYRRDWSNDQKVGTIREGSGASSGRLTGLTGTVNGQNRIWYGAQGVYRVAGDPFFATASIPDWVYLPQSNRMVYDLSRHQYLMGASNHKTANFVGRYDVFPEVRVIAEGFFTNRNSSERLSPEPMGFNITTTKYPTGFLIPALLPDGTPNPQNPYGANITNALIRIANGGDRVYKDNVNTYRLRAGFEGTAFNDYDWQLGYQYGESDAVYRLSGALNFDHLAKLTGQRACGTDTAIGCSVANFLGTATLTPTQLSYLQYTNVRVTQTSQAMMYASVSGPIMDLPAGPLAFALGAENRNEAGYDRPDSIQVQGDASSDAKPTEGHYSIASTYLELNVPLFKDEWFAKSLTLNLSGRYDSTSVFGDATTYKIGLDYAVTDDIRLRGTDSTGFRAPQIKELFGGAYQSFPQGNDPCKNNGGAFIGSPNCVRDLVAAGVNPATFTDNNVQLRTINGGNPNLKAEVSRAVTIGVALTPSWIPNLSLTVDYYHTRINGPIVAATAQTVANNCYNPAIALQSACALISRQVGTGAIIQVLATNLNIGSQMTNGLDFSAQYSMPAEMIYLPDVGTFDFSINANNTFDNIQTDVAGNKTFLAGSYSTSVSGAQPRLKATMAATFNSYDDWSFTYSPRYVGHVENLDRTTYRSPAICSVNCGQYLGNFATGFFYHDISASYKYNNIGVTVGVDNLLDKDPPYLADLFTNSIVAGPYDYTGRFMYMKVKLDM